MSHRQAVLLERLHRVVHSPGDEIRVAAADVDVPGKVGSTVCRPGVRVRRRRPIDLSLHYVGCWVILRLELHICQLRHTDCPNNWALFSRVGVGGLAMEAVVQVKWIMVRLWGSKVGMLSNFRLTVNQGIGPAVSICVADVKISH